MRISDWSSDVCSSDLVASINSSFLRILQQQHQEYSMSDLPNNPIGAAWLAQEYQLLPIGRLPVHSQIGGRRATQISDGDRLETYPETGRASGRESVCQYV